MRWKIVPLDDYMDKLYKCTVCGWEGEDNYDSYVRVGNFKFCPECGIQVTTEEAKEEPEKGSKYNDSKLDAIHDRLFSGEAELFKGHAKKRFT